MIKVAVDAMGGDLAPVEMVAGAVEAVNAKPGIQVLLVGQEAVVNKELSKYTYNKEQIQVVNATEVIATEEPPRAVPTASCASPVFATATPSAPFARIPPFV